VRVCGRDEAQDARREERQEHMSES
jgi:hypothetical protein